jgi:hypothetical protein
MAAQLRLFDLLDAADGGRQAFARAADGPGRLLRELVRRGLEEDARPAAAMLVLAMDEEAPS